MKKLILMRHAESQLERHGLNDRDRSVSCEGMQDLDIIRQKLQGKLHGLNLVLCSNVKRARQTLEGIKAILPSTCQSMFDDGLYHAPVSGFVTRLQRLENTLDCVMMIAHNPGVSNFLNAVIKSDSSATKLPKLFPTSGVAIFEGSFHKWQNITPTHFKLQTFLTPDG